MTPLVLIPGMMCDARLFAPQMADLSGQRSIMVASIAGHDTMADMAASLLAQAPPRFALAGLSLGGIVAMEMFARAPERVERIALMDTNHLPEPEHMRPRRKRQMADVRGGLLGQVMREDMKPKYLADGPNRPALLDLCMDMALGLGADVFIRQSRALMDRPDQTETLRRIACPAMILCGRDDKVCPLERHQTMAALIPGATLEIIDNAGHLPCIEQPDATNTALKRWLEE